MKAHCYNVVYIFFLNYFDCVVVTNEYNGLGDAFNIKNLTISFKQQDPLNFQCFIFQQMYESYVQFYHYNKHCYQRLPIDAIASLSYIVNHFHIIHIDQLMKNFITK